MDPENGQSRTLLTIVAIAILVVAGGAIWYMTRGAGTADEFTDATNTPRGSGTLAPAAQNQNLVIYRPQMNERVGTPLVIEGEARAFENTVNFRLLDATGRVIAEGFATADAREAGTFGSFRGELNFVSETDQEGTLEIFTAIAKDGETPDILSIPVIITKTPGFIKG